MKSVAKNANIGDVASRPTMSSDGSFHPIFARLNIFFAVRVANTSVRIAKRRGVQRRRFPSMAAVLLFPAAFWIAAAA